MPGRTPAADGLQALDRRDLAWYVDRGMQVLIFCGGMSAIVRSGRTRRCGIGADIPDRGASVPRA